MKKLIRTFLLFSPLALLWSFCFFFLFLFTNDFEKQKELYLSGNTQYKAGLDRLGKLRDFPNVGSLGVILLSFLAVLLSFLFFLVVYEKYKEDITILKLRHMPFRSSNGFFFLSTLGTSLLYEGLGLLFGFLVAFAFDRFFFGLPCFVHELGRTGILILLISSFLEVIGCSVFFLLPFRGKALIHNVRRMQR